MQSSILKSIAVHNPFTVKPSINLSANKIITALITNKKRPSDSIVTGKVKSINIGFTNTFKTDITAATNNEVT